METIHLHWILTDFHRFTWILSVFYDFHYFLDFHDVGGSSRGGDPMIESKPFRINGFRMVFFVDAASVRRRFGEVWQGLAIGSCPLTKQLASLEPGVLELRGFEAWRVGFEAWRRLVSGIGGLLE